MKKSKFPKLCLSSFDLTFSKTINFFLIFTFQRPSNHRKMCVISSLRDFSYIKQFHDPSFVSKRYYNSKRFQSDFLIFFQNYRLNQYYCDHQFCHFSTAKIPSWYMAFRERAMLPLTICEIKSWGNSNCEFLQLKTFTVLTWFTTFELAVVAELWRAKRPSGAPWVSKSTHPRKFGNHVTVHRPPARPLPVRLHHRHTNVYSHTF